MTAIAISVGLGPVLAALSFAAGLALGARRATAERLRWHYVTCASLMGLRKLLDERDEDLRSHLTMLAQTQYRLWRDGPRVDPPPFSPATDELFSMADREFSTAT